MVACAVADIGRLEHRYLASLPSTRADQLHDLESQIAIGDGFAVALYVLVAAAGVAAFVWSRRSPRGRPRRAVAGAVSRRPGGHFVAAAGGGR